MTKEKAVFDTNTFNKLILLPLDGIDRLRNNFELFVTDVSIKELSRMKEGEEKDRIFNLIKECFEIKSAGIFAFASYTDPVHEDSAVGFARWGSENKGRMLRWEDAALVKEIGLERRKISKGTSFNDTAIALAVPKGAIFVTDEIKGYGNKLNQLGMNAMSFDEFLQLNGIILSEGAGDL